MAKTNKVCPECGHEFQGNGWDGIDAHWKSKHDKTMRYEDAWPLIESGRYSKAVEGRRKSKGLDFSQNALRIVRESTEE